MFKIASTSEQLIYASVVFKCKPCGWVRNPRVRAAIAQLFCVWSVCPRSVLLTSRSHKLVSLTFLDELKAHEQDPIIILLPIDKKTKMSKVVNSVTEGRSGFEFILAFEDLECNWIWFPPDNEERITSLIIENHRTWSNSRYILTMSEVRIISKILIGRATAWH